VQKVLFEPDEHLSRTGDTNVSDSWLMLSRPLLNFLLVTPAATCLHIDYCLHTDYWLVLGCFLYNFVYLLTYRQLIHFVILQHFINFFLIRHMGPLGHPSVNFVLCGRYAKLCYFLIFAVLYRLYNIK